MSIEDVDLTLNELQEEFKCLKMVESQHIDYQILAILPQQRIYGIDNPLHQNGHTSVLHPPTALHEDILFPEIQ